MGWFSWFSAGNVAAVLFAAIVFKAVTNLRDLTDPLRDFDGSATEGSASGSSTIIYPSWEMGQKFHLCAFTSRSSRFSPFQVSAKAENKELLLSRGNLIFDNQTQMDDVTIHLDLVSDDEYVWRDPSSRHVQRVSLQYRADRLLRRHFHRHHLYGVQVHPLEHPCCLGLAPGREACRGGHFTR